MRERIKIYITEIKNFSNVSKQPKAEVFWWDRQGSNLRPRRYERPALTAELQSLKKTTRSFFKRFFANYSKGLGIVEIFSFFARNKNDLRII